MSRWRASCWHDRNPDPPRHPAEPTRRRYPHRRRQPCRLGRDRAARRRPAAPAPAHPGRPDRRAPARLTRRLLRPQPVRRAGRLVLDRRPGLAARPAHPDPRPRHLVRLRRHPGRRARGVVRRQLEPGRPRREPGRRRQRLRAARRHPPRAHHQRHDRDLDPRLRHGRDARRLQRPPLLRLTSIETARGNQLPPITEGAAAMSLVRVHNFAISLDGFGTGEPQSHDAPFGHAGERLHEWMFATRWWNSEMSGQPGGSGGVDHAFARQHGPGIGAEIMGAGKFGPPGWHEDPEWRGWWGPNPPFHTAVFVLTHHTRPSIEMEGGTTYHFIDASPAEALETAREAAGGQDVRIGGGPTVIRDFLAARLVDHMHVAVVPILLGRGVRLWTGLEGLEKDYRVEATSSPSGVTHLTFTRAGV